jgi:perosamine synthetase
MYEEGLLIADVCRLPYTDVEIDQCLEAIQKVWMNRGSLHDYEKNQGVSRA